MALIKKEYHQLDIDEICNTFNSQIDYGLTNDKVAIARDKYGLNQLTPPPQANCCTSYVCLYCCFVGIALSFCIIIIMIHFNIPLLIFVVFLSLVIISSLIFIYWIYKQKTESWFYTPNKSKQYLDNKFSFHQATVIRNQTKICLLVNGYIRDNNNNQNMIKDITHLIERYCTSESLMKIKAEELVPGDIVILQKGNVVPADIRLIECSDDFTVNEACLTGENAAVHKNPKRSNGDLVESEANNVLFFGCNVMSGKAKGIVYAIGDSTFMSRIAGLADRGQDYDHHCLVIKQYQTKCSCLLCLFTTVIFFFFPETFLLFMLWSIIGSIIIFITGFIILSIWISKYGVMKSLRDDANLNIKYVESVEALPIINVIIMNIRYLITNKNDPNLLIKECHSMGIKIVLFSDNDNNKTKDISHNIGLNNPMFVDNDDIKSNDDQYFDEIAINTRNESNDIIFSNASAVDKHKFKMLKALQNNGYYCCVIGESVDDSRSLKEARIGIAINQCSTDVAKEAADVICFSSDDINDNYFNSIINGIKISRKFTQSFGNKLAFMHAHVCNC